MSHDSTDASAHIPVVNTGGVEKELTGQQEATRLSDLSPQQWKSGIAAWLGWLFDGLDMHLFTLVAASFVAILVDASSPTDPMVKKYGSYIQAAFLVGWALGGAFFGRLGDRIGRSRSLSLTILTYAIFTGLSFFAQTWWQLMIFRFIAALGIGGEWAVGASLLSETWPKKWRPWIAAVLQTGVNLGVLLACLTEHLMSGMHPKFVFLVGIVPAFLVFWIRRHVPEPEEWHQAKSKARAKEPGIIDLFGKDVRRTTLLTIGLCACSLTGWWAFMFWNLQHLRTVPGVADLPPAEIRKLVAWTFAMIITSSVGGNFFASVLARYFGYRKGIAILCAGFFLSLCWVYSADRSRETLAWSLPMIGFFSGMFGLFTMYLPPLFPTLLRTTGAGFSYNIGRIAAAIGTVVFVQWQLGDLRAALFAVSFLFIPAMIFALLMPELPHGRNAGSAG
jgi:MFS family permease